jgi:hypothetical protein
MALPVESKPLFPLHDYLKSLSDFFDGKISNSETALGRVKRWTCNNCLFSISFASNSMTTGNNVCCVNISFIIRVSSYRKGYFNLSYICSSPPSSFRKSCGKGESYFMALPLNPMSVREVRIYIFIAHTNNSSGSPGLWTFSKLFFFFWFFVWIRCDRTSVCCLYFHKTWSRANK